MRILFDRKNFKIFSAVLILLIFLNIIVFSSWGHRIFSVIVNPGSSWLRKSSQNLEDSEKSREELEEEVSSLQEKLLKSEVELAKFNSTEEENSKLRQYLNFLNNKSAKYVLANVVWQENLLNFSHYNQNIVIDRGSRDGLYEGLAVVNEAGVIVGKIIAVEKDSSRVCLINNSFCQMAVSLSNEERTVGLAEGDLGLSVKISFVSQSEKVNVGDQIITSGLEKNIPRGLAVGRVNNVEQEVNDIWQKINAEALFNINDLNIVSVIVPQ